MGQDKAEPSTPAATDKSLGDAAQPVFATAPGQPVSTPTPGPQGGAPAAGQQGIAPKLPTKKEIKNKYNEASDQLSQDSINRAGENKKNGKDSDKDTWAKQQMKNMEDLENWVATAAPKMSQFYKDAFKAVITGAKEQYNKWDDILNDRNQSQKSNKLATPAANPQVQPQPSPTPAAQGQPGAVGAAPPAVQTPAASASATSGGQSEAVDAAPHKVTFHKKSSSAVPTPAASVNANAEGQSGPAVSQVQPGDTAKPVAAPSPMALSPAPNTPTVAAQQSLGAIAGEQSSSKHKVEPIPTPAPAPEETAPKLS